MNKKICSFLSVILLCALLSCLLLPAAAEPQQEEEAPKPVTISIRSMDDFLQFSAKCVRNVYSENLIVSLETDLDFTDQPFTSVPIFSGIFDGNRHSIKGLHLTVEGSDQGLFRYLTSSAIVKNLTVSGTFLPEGSKKAAGSIAGINAGQIRDCHFEGEAAGSEAVGGIVGINEVTGIIDSCTVSGSIHGIHFVGGIAGRNGGTIRNCKNQAQINTEEAHNTIKPSSLQQVTVSTDLVTGKESAATVTDLGGIAGTSSGVIRDCVNHGEVGYPRMGYNIGGIAGSQQGYLRDCKNYGKINGRKEVAGIAGQLEPVLDIHYTEDTLQILRRQLDATSSLASRASANIQSSAQGMQGDIDDLGFYAENALDAVDALIPHGGDWPDLDTIIAAHNSLGSSLSSMQGSMSSLNQNAQSMVGNAAADIRAINGQIRQISETLDSAAENLGVTITDISDEDTPDDHSAKIESCQNHGEVSADLNVGGIAGAVSWENDLDPEEDYTVSGDRSLNADSKMRAVILNCLNASKIQVNKKNAGGIAGSLNMGLIKNCTNTGFVESEEAQYLGGIAGISQGFIRDCSVKCKLRGKSYMGGIAGSASTVSGCRSTVMMDDDGERIGSVLGGTSQDRHDLESPITGNYYVPLADHLGAIDGIDYFGIADSLSKEQFVKLEGLSSIFFHSTMNFRYPDGSSQKLVVPMGEVVPRSKIPEPPRKEGYIVTWDMLDELDLSHMFFNVTLTPEYRPIHTVLESDLRRENGNVILLMEGTFQENAPIELIKSSEMPAEKDPVEAWMLPQTEQDAVFHLSVPEKMNPEDARILIQDASGQWQQRQASRDGSYLVFTANADDQAVAVYESHQRVLTETLTFVGGAAAVLLVLGIILYRKRRKKKLQRTSATGNK